MGQQLSSLGGHIRDLVNAIWLLFNTAVAQLILGLTSLIAGLGLQMSDRYPDHITFNMILGAIFTAIGLMMCIRAFVMWFNEDLDGNGQSAEVVIPCPRITYHRVQQQRFEASDIQSTTSSDSKSETSIAVSDVRSQSPIRPLSDSRSSLRVMWSDLLFTIQLELYNLSLWRFFHPESRREVNEREAQIRAQNVKAQLYHYLARRAKGETAPLLSSRAKRYDMYAPSTSSQRTDISWSPVSREPDTAAKSKPSAKATTEDAETSASAISTPTRSQQAAGIPSSLQSPLRPPLERLLRSASEIAMEATKYSISPRKRLLSAVVEAKDPDAQPKRAKHTPLARTESGESKETDISGTESLELSEKSTSEEKSASGESGTDNSKDEQPNE